MLADGLLRHLIAENYTRQSLESIKEVLAAYRTHQIVPLAHGLVAAQPPDSPSQRLPKRMGSRQHHGREFVPAARGTCFRDCRHGGIGIARNSARSDDQHEKIAAP